MQTRLSSPVALAAGVLLACTVNPWSDEKTVDPVALSEGTYHVVFGHGYAAADETRLLAVTARLDRANGQLVLTAADGSKQTLVFSPRPVEAWQPDCPTMGGHSLDEVADLSPAPVQLESLTFATPIVYAKCGPRRMILANAPNDETAFLAFDLQ